MLNWIKNRLGARMGYGTCPNCNDNWWWKAHSPNSVIMYDRCNGMMLCDECFADIPSIDGDRIQRELYLSGWDSPSITHVRLALARLQHPERARY